MYLYATTFVSGGPLVVHDPFTSRLHAEAEKRLAAFKQLTEKFQKMIDSGKLQIVLWHGWS